MRFGKVRLIIACNFSNSDTRIFMHAKILSFRGRKLFKRIIMAHFMTFRANCMNRKSGINVFEMQCGWSYMNAIDAIRLSLREQIFAWPLCRYKSVLRIYSRRLGKFIRIIYAHCANIYSSRTHCPLISRLAYIVG